MNMAILVAALARHFIALYPIEKVYIKLTITVRLELLRKLLLIKYKCYTVHYKILLFMNTQLAQLISVLYVFCMYFLFFFLYVLYLDFLYCM